MNTKTVSRTLLTTALILTLASGLSYPLIAAPSSASAKALKKLKVQVRTLKKQLAAARRPVPDPVPCLDLVDIGDPGNVADSSGYGAVSYRFRMAKTEVTLNQYSEFLNAVAAISDTYTLYNSNMGTDTAIAGIQKSGEEGNYSYSVIGDGNRPVTYISWFDAARFCNWLHNGRPSGEQTVETTERGAYTLDGATAGIGIDRQWGAKYWIPSEDEWYKAAFHDPRDQADGGPSGNDHYWLYPTMSEVAPGNTPGSLPNQANFDDGNYSIQPGPNRLAPVGSYSGSPSYYGTFDQGGSLWEWNDAVIAGDSRGQRSGSWDNAANSLRTLERGQNPPGSRQNLVGFRVAAQE